MTKYLRCDPSGRLLSLRIDMNFKSPFNCCMLQNCVYRKLHSYLKVCTKLLPTFLKFFNLFNQHY